MTFATEPSGESAPITCGRAGIGVKAFERVAHDILQQAHFVVAQLGVFPPAAIVSQSAVVLADEHDQILRQPIRHFDGVHDPPQGIIVPAQVIDLPRQTCGASHQLRAIPADGLPRLAGQVAPEKISKGLSAAKNL